MLKPTKIKRTAKSLLIIMIGFLLIVLVFLPSTGRASTNFSYSIQVDYTAHSSGPTAVNETYNITNNTSSQYLDSIKISTPSAEVTNLKVYYLGGKSIPFTTQMVESETAGFKSEYTQININFNVAKVGQGLKWAFVVEYQTTGLVEDKGSSNVVYIPGISPNGRDFYRASLTVPDTFGPVHGFGNLPREVSRGNGTRTYSFEQNELIDNSLQLLFGDSTTYKANFIYPLENNSDFPKLFKITLPPNTSGQTVFIQKIDPTPESMSVDADGNIIASYNIKPHQNISVSADVLAVVKYISYDLSKSGNMRDIPSNLVRDYTKSTQYWQSNNPDIQKQAKELTKDMETVAQKVRAINNYVIEKLDYNNEKINYNLRQGALKAFQNPSFVVCLEYSDLTIALLRSAGIPARMPIGYGYSGSLKKSTTVTDSLHSWVSVYIPNIGWMNMDPTWGEKFNNYGVSDIDHFAFAIWGKSDSSPAAITSNNVDANYQYEKVTISYTEVQTKVLNDASLKVTKWVLLPFLSLTQFSGSAPSNTAISYLKLKIKTPNGAHDKQLGNQAPSQKFSGNILWFSRDFLDKSEASIVSPESITPLATTTASVNYAPLVLIICLVSVIIIWRVLRHHNNKIKNATLLAEEGHDPEETKK